MNELDQNAELQNELDSLQLDPSLYATGDMGGNYTFEPLDRAGKRITPKGEKDRGHGMLGGADSPTKGKGMGNRNKRTQGRQVEIFGLGGDSLFIDVPQEKLKKFDDDPTSKEATMTIGEVRR